MVKMTAPAIERIPGRPGYFSGRGGIPRGAPLFFVYRLHTVCGNDIMWLNSVTACPTGYWPARYMEAFGLMLKGVFTPAILAFDPEGNIDYDANRRLMERLIACGVDGILFLGSIGEFFTLSFEEKKKLISFAVRTAAGRTRVLVGTGGTVESEVIALTRYAESEGADAAVVISPYYVRLDDGDLYRYYARVASGVKMPVLIYNFPDRTAVNISPLLVRRLAEDFPNIAGIKDTVDNISHTRKILRAVKDLPREFSVFSGYDEYFIPNLEAGGAGIISGLTNIAPGLFVSLYRAYGADDLAGVRKFQTDVNTLMGVYDASPLFISSIKAAVAQLVPGVCADPRRPHVGCSEAQTGEIRGLLEAAGLL